MANNKYPIRRDSLISPWGVGAIVPFPHDESLMISGLDFWFDENHNYKDFVVVDERLSRRLDNKIFVKPPDFRKVEQDKLHAEMRIPAVRFPLWHYCPVCGNMEKSGESGQRLHCTGELRKSNGRDYCSKNIGKSRPMPELVPERFIAVCKRGHIEDFPIMEWVHRKSDKPINEGTCKIVRSTGGSSASLAGVRYTCTCGATATMSGAFGKDALANLIGYRCRGNRPWLGGEQCVECGESLLVLQRGASNVWFADIISSVYIPWIPEPKNQATRDCIVKVVKKFSSSRTNGRLDEEGIKKMIAVLKEYDEDINEEQVLKEALSTLRKADSRDENLAQTEDEYRKQEFDVLTRNAGKPEEELYVKNYKQEKYKGLDFLKSVSLVHKLRETRVFQGFRRISPSGDSELAQISVKELNWLPAVENSGEGIMFEFDQDKLDEWANRENVKRRVAIIESNLRNSKKLAVIKLNPKYILLHTFAHCLINALASKSGYSNASIREKIYSSQYVDGNAPKMAGVLIYTASGDSEGSLGGLVRQGLPGRIEDVILGAISEARWCAADPVCIQSSGQGQYGVNLAACHNCALLPETSCENKNMLLDRGLLIGTLDDNTIGYFNDYEEN